MKKLSIVIALILMIIKTVNAQTQKGDQSLGLSFSFSSASQNYNYTGPNPISYGTITSTAFTTTPGYSYFIANNLDIGAGIEFGDETAHQNAPNDAGGIVKTINKIYSPTIYLRKYFLFDNKIGIRTGPYFLYQYSNSNSISPSNSATNYNSTSHYSQAGINADFVYYPSKKIGLALNIGSLSYNHQRFNDSQSYNTSDNGVSLQFLTSNLMLSAYYVFGN
jgi:hypothetical protein